jgi:hypothetical protein
VRRFLQDATVVTQLYFGMYPRTYGTQTEGEVHSTNPLSFPDLEEIGLQFNIITLRGVIGPRHLRVIPEMILL